MFITLEFQQDMLSICVTERSTIVMNSKQEELFLSCVRQIPGVGEVVLDDDIYNDQLFTLVVTKDPEASWPRSKDDEGVYHPVLDCLVTYLGTDGEEIHVIERVDPALNRSGRAYVPLGIWSHKSCGPFAEELKLLDA